MSQKIKRVIFVKLHAGWDRTFLRTIEIEPPLNQSSVYIGRYYVIITSYLKAQY